MSLMIKLLTRCHNWYRFKNLKCSTLTIEDHRQKNSKRRYEGSGAESKFVQTNQNLLNKRVSYYVSGHGKSNDLLQSTMPYNTHANTNFFEVADYCFDVFTWKEYFRTRSERFSTALVIWWWILSVILFDTIFFNKLIEVEMTLVIPSPNNGKSL